MDKKGFLLDECLYYWGGGGGLAGGRPHHSSRHLALVGLPTGANDVYESAFNFPFSFWKL